MGEWWTWLRRVDIAGVLASTAAVCRQWSRKFSRGSNMSPEKIAPVCPRASLQPNASRQLLNRRSHRKVQCAEVRYQRKVALSNVPGAGVVQAERRCSGRYSTASASSATTSCGWPRRPCEICVPAPSGPGVAPVFAKLETACRSGGPADAFVLLGAVTASAIPSLTLYLRQLGEETMAALLDRGLCRRTRL